MQRLNVNERNLLSNIWLYKNIEEQFYKAVLPGCDSIKASEAVASKVGSILARMAFSSLKNNKLLNY